MEMREKKERWRQKGGEEGEGRERGESNQQRGREGGRENREREREREEGEGGTNESKLWKVLCSQLLRNLDADFRDPLTFPGTVLSAILSLCSVCVFFGMAQTFNVPHFASDEAHSTAKTSPRKLVSNFPSCVISRRLCS